MSSILSILKNAVLTIGEIFKLLWSLFKWLMGKCWRVILILGSILLAIFSIKKATKED